MRREVIMQALESACDAGSDEERGTWGRHWTNPAERRVYERVTQRAWGLIACPLRTRRRRDGALYERDVARRIPVVAEHLAFSGEVPPEDQAAFLAAMGYAPTTDAVNVEWPIQTIPSCHRACSDGRRTLCPDRARVVFARHLASTLELVFSYECAYDRGLGMPRSTERRPERIEPPAAPCYRACRHRGRRRGGARG